MHACHSSHAEVCKYKMRYLQIRDIVVPVFVSAPCCDSMLRSGGTVPCILNLGTSVGECVAVHTGSSTHGEWFPVPN